MATLLSDKVMNVWDNLVFTKGDNKLYHTLTGSDTEITTLASNLTFSGRFTVSNAQVELSGILAGNAAETLTHIVKDSTNKLEYLSSADLCTNIKAGGWHGSSVLMKILPTEFMADAGGTNYVFDTASGVKKITSSAKLYVSKAIPSGYKIDRFEVHANNNTSSVVDAYAVDFRNGTRTTITSNQDFNNEINILGVTSSSTNYFLLETEPGTSDVIYGVSVILERV
tara:strand:- start:2385 stop:3062 length:678 start_codon:yes stop_codon:yes gene_type:complete